MFRSGIKEYQLEFLCGIANWDNIAFIALPSAHRGFSRFLKSLMILCVADDQFEAGNIMFFLCSVMLLTFTIIFLVKEEAIFLFSGGICLKPFLYRAVTSNLAGDPQTGQLDQSRPIHSL